MTDLSSQAEMPRYQVLVADDDHDTVDSTAMIFQLQGHRVRTAYDGSEAFRQAVAFRPDIVLLDIAMPGMDGCAVARALRGITVTSEPLLVAVSGFGERADKQRSAEAGFDLHLTKPVDFSQYEQMLTLWRASDDLRGEGRRLKEEIRAATQKSADVVRRLLDLRVEMAGTLLDVAMTTQNPRTRERCLQQALKAHYTVSNLSLIHI